MARILVVDDSPDQLAQVEVHLSGGEFEVVTASDGRAALDACRQQDFDLILLDVRMPGVDGFEVCRRLKDNPRTAFVPVIFLTGHFASESRRSEAYALGAVDYVQKPARRDELVARVQVMLRMQEARNRLALENSRLGRALLLADRELEAAQQHIADLSALTLAQAHPEVGLLMLGEGCAVAAVDAVAARLVPELRVGRRPAAQGPVGTALAELHAAGEGRRSVPIPAAEGEPRRQVTFEVVPMPDMALLAVRVADPGAVERVRQRLLRREVAPPAGFAAAEAADAVGDGVGAEGASGSGYAVAGFVGRSPAVRAMNKMVDRLRRGFRTVLVRGESGTGKELVARALHFDGPHSTSPFIPIHCGAIAAALIESELFGFEKGSFTGAERARDGLFVAADGGTVFLDEVAEMSLELQVKLLRVLQLGEIKPVGSNEHRIVDVRVIAATNGDLKEMVADGRFRSDLYYRLEGVTVEIPPLRERIEDLPLLVERFIQDNNRRYQRQDRPVRGVTNGVMQKLMACSWPGNVRQLESVIDRAFVLGAGEVVRESDLPEDLLSESAGAHGGAARQAAVGEEGDGGGRNVLSLRERREAVDRELYRQALQQCGGDRAEVARLLGVGRSTAYRRLRELGL